jgi:hypothetical protein
MADTECVATATASLEKLATALSGYDNLSAKVVRHVVDPPYLRVVNREAPDLAEAITCGACDGKPVYLWSWNEQVGGGTLGEHAQQIAHVLRATPGPPPTPLIRRM